jgi:hypothetical protein
VSSGPKQYGALLLTTSEATGTEEDYRYILKLRGMTLNYDVIENQGLRYETFKENVLHYARTGEARPIEVLYPNFLRPSIKDGIVYTQPLHKIWKPVCSKGVVRPSDTRVLDFGFIPQN